MKSRLRLADRAADAVFPDVTTLIGEPSLDRLTSAALETTDSSGRALLFKMREMLYETEFRGAAPRDILQTLVRTVTLLSDKIPCRQGIGGVFEVLDSAGADLPDASLSDTVSQILTVGTVGRTSLTIDRTLSSARLFSRVLDTYAKLAAIRTPMHPLAVMLGRTTASGDALLIADAVAAGGKITVVSKASAASAYCGSVPPDRLIWCDIPAIPGVTAANLIDVAADGDLTLRDEISSTCENLITEALDRFAKPLYRTLKGRHPAYRQNSSGEYPLAAAALFYPNCISSASGNARDIFEGGAPDRRIVLRFALSNAGHARDILHAASYAAYIHEQDYPAKIVPAVHSTHTVGSYADAVRAIKSHAEIRHGELGGGSTLTLKFEENAPSREDTASLIRGAVGLGVTALEIRFGDTNDE